MSRTVRVVMGVCGVAALSAAVVAQQPPQIGIAPVALTAGPYVFDTAEQHKIAVSVVARGLAHPFSLAFLPDGDLQVVTIQGEEVVIGRYLREPGIVIGETTVPRVPPAPDLACMWVGEEVLLQGDGRAWLLELAEGEK